MSVPVSWVLSQSDLALLLVGGATGVDRELDLVLTTELEHPFPWLSGRELVLTTGIRLPPEPQQRAAYLRGLDERGVAAVGFGTGLTYEEVPPDLITAADEIGIPLFDVPLPTPFAAIVKRVTARLAELQHIALLRASRAQPRMTRALVRAGAPAVVRELATSLTATVLMLDPSGDVVATHPGTPDDELLRTVRTAIATEPPGAASSVLTAPSGTTITHQRISVGPTRYGTLAVVGHAPLGPTDQILLGHANSLLALDFEKPARLQAAQNLLNSHALGLLLSSDTDLGPAWAQLAEAADAQGRIRVLVVDCDTEAAAEAVRTTITAAIIRTGQPLFMQSLNREVVVVLPGTPGTTVAHRIEIDTATSKLTRSGISDPHPVHDLITALANARLAASAAERGAAPAEFAPLAGRSLLSFDATRQALASIGDTVLGPLADHDRVYGTDLMTALRAFLEANGQWESAATATGVHRHTLRKRISMAETLLGVDLDSARVRAELLLAMLARRA
ncbi:PucR family transcriptional regulator [Nocardia sp. NPDC005998]|uniref:PucR family transcriptional regulator n=1 Tax=Nocardia sp. NPDC005998 TaxID=3156894 RepID=UPI0033A5D40B